MQESHAGSEVVVPLSGDSGRCCESPGSGARSQKAWCVLRASKGRGSSLPAGQQSGIRCPLQACVLQGRLGEYFKRLFLKKVFIYFLSVLCFVAEQAFSSCGEGAYSPVTVPGLLIVVASLVGTRTLDAQASVFAARKHSSCSSQTLERRLRGCGPQESTARGIFPGQGSTPCTLCWQADSYSLYH